MQNQLKLLFILLLISPVLAFSQPSNEVKRLAQYNLWANEQMLAWLAQASTTQLDSQLISSFSSLRLTLIHIYGAERGWLSLLQAGEWAGLSDAEGLSFEVLSQQFREGSQALATYAGALKPEALSEKRIFGRSGSKASQADILLHVLNHSTYHRGQLISLGRQAGLESPPRTDYIYWIQLLDE
ncbi:MAG: DinB family protein [Bacteroidia bacterium]